MVFVIGRQLVGINRRFGGCKDEKEGFAVLVQRVNQP